MMPTWVYQIHEAVVQIVKYFLFLFCSKVCYSKSTVAIVYRGTAQSYVQQIIESRGGAQDQLVPS